MEGRLAKELQKYYTRQGKTLVFRNGMTLNRLADTMDEILDGTIDRSVASKVLNGHRLFTPEQLEVFCTLMNATGEEKWNLHHALIKGKYDKHDIGIDLTISPILLENWDTLLMSIRQHRNQGFPHRALADAIALSEVVRRTGATAESSPLYQESRRILATTLWEQVCNHTQIASASEIQRAKTQLSGEIRELAVELEDEELVGLSDFAQGNLEYVLGNYGASIRWCKEALNHIKGIPDSLSILRTMALNLAYLDDVDEFKVVEEQATLLIRKACLSDLGVISFVYEGVGRARGILRLPGAMEILAQCEAMIEEMNRRRETQPFLAIGVARSQLELICSSGSSDKTYLDRIGEKCLALAKEHGYRHERLIRELLDKSL